MKEITLKYYSIIFCPITFTFIKTEKEYIYNVISVAEYRKKYNIF